MADFTIDDPMIEARMVKIRYDWSEREIYNDIRSEIGFIEAQTVLDQQTQYSWGVTSGASAYLDPGEYREYTIKAGRAAISWRIDWMYAHSVAEYKKYNVPYFDYQAGIKSSSSSSCTISLKNTGSLEAHIKIGISYQYLSAEAITHEETAYVTDMVRAVNEVSIRKYGRRVMPLTWPEGTEKNQMQTIVDRHCARYCEPMPQVIVTFQGKNDILLEQIYAREVSDIIRVECDNLGLSADFYINSISIKDTADKIPLCTWGLEWIRDYEKKIIFTLDTSFLDGEHVLG